MAIKLYDLAGSDPEILFSPYCWRVRMSLLHKGLEFASIPWRFLEKETIAESGHKAVPVINDGGTWVGDSWGIVKYLDEKYPNQPTLLNGAEGEAHASLVQELCASLVFPAVIPVAIYPISQLLDEEDRAYFLKTREAALGNKLSDINADPDTGKANLEKALIPFNNMLKNTQFIGGNTPTYADYCLFGVLKWADVVSPYRPINDSSALGEWFVRLENMYDAHAANAPTVRNRSQQHS
jgi:glutathione S-transferase